ncbi:hypothetical protein GCM10027079_23450 [Sediminivirga luteola]|uniref:Uncharacterized protein n=1 Tax=Sediminivirga luteola TaxID=1774748 RepID=A0A8J2U1E4_9MICO|nr:hypothetical protein GCM10011333_34220 [Sediminivirga luteola]
MCDSRGHAAGCDENSPDERDHSAPDDREHSSEPPEGAGVADGLKYVARELRDCPATRP